LFTLGQSGVNIWFPSVEGSGVKSEIINLINSTSNSLYFAVYDINDEELANHFLARYQKGIDVKVIMDDTERRYFINNIKHGITTFQDNAILKNLSLATRL
jgi:phosphatidylserine/phosphatidylglycerophosphate/cardiolipin synthase-like enzyme